MEETPTGWSTTRFVGRASELGVLRRAASFAERGHGQIVGIVGEAGVGKSRLVREAIRGAPGLACSCRWRGAVHEGDAGAPLPELLRALCHIPPADGAAEARERVMRALPDDAEPA